MSAALPDLIAAALERDAARPLLTYYDDATGERVELSGATMANWVAKIANLMQDEYDVGRGVRVAVLLPAHWQSAAVLLATWLLGAEATTDPSVATVVFGTETSLGDLAPGGPPRIALSLLPLGRPFDGVPADAQDFAVLVPPQPDAFAAYDAPADGDLATSDGADQMPAGELAQLAEESAGALGLGPADRVLVAGAAERTDDLLLGLLAPLAACASLVLVAHPDPAVLPDRCAAELVTATVGIDVAGVRRLDTGAR